MRIDGYARYALLGALVVSLACARNKEDMNDTGATGSVTTTDTGATIRVRPDTNVADTAGTGAIGDTSQGTRTDPDSTAGAGAASDTLSPGAGWPADSSRGGWSIPPDSL